ncbi:MAG: acyltransferase [Bacteroidetes bacterium]|nr:acyltransferase [Bacteroidota bacterium]
MHSQKKHFEVLDGLRGIAALGVVVFHFMEVIEPESAKNIIGHGFLAVDFFFCLSGFVIAYSYDDRIVRLGLREFFRSRIIRLHPLVVFGSVLGLLGYLFDPFGGQLPGAFRIAWLFVGSVLLIPLPAMADRAYNLFGLNAPAWSLFWEYVANICYGVFLSRMKRRYLSILIVPAAAAIGWVIYKEGSLLGGWNGLTFWDGFVRVSYSFLAGMVVYRYGWGVKNRLGFLIMSAMLVVAFLVPFSKWNLLSEGLIVLVYFPLIVALGAGAIVSPRVERVCLFFGKLSYPLYMSHYWAIWIFAGYYSKYKPGGVELLLVVLGGIVFLVGLAYAVMVLFDVPVRRRLKFLLM